MSFWLSRCVCVSVCVGRIRAKDNSNTVRSKEFNVFSVWENFPFRRWYHNNKQHTGPCLLRLDSCTIIHSLLIWLFSCLVDLKLIYLLKEKEGFEFIKNISLIIIIYIFILYVYIKGSLKGSLWWVFGGPSDCWKDFIFQGGKHVY